MRKKTSNSKKAKNARQKQLLNAMICENPNVLKLIESLNLVLTKSI
jgi:hypothetical protein